MTNKMKRQSPTLTPTRNHTTLTGTYNLIHPCSDPSSVSVLMLPPLKKEKKTALQNFVSATVATSLPTLATFLPRFFPRFAPASRLLAWGQKHVNLVLR